MVVSTITKLIILDNADYQLFAIFEQSERGQLKMGNSVISIVKKSCRNTQLLFQVVLQQKPYNLIMKFACVLLPTNIITSCDVETVY